ncbi:hypothetical protein ACFXPI_05650 [Streptomyces sp. NPDC059104]
MPRGTLDDLIELGTVTAEDEPWQHRPADELAYWRTRQHLH